MLTISTLSVLPPLRLVTMFISFLSDFLMDAVKEAAVQLSIPMPFLIAIVVPIVGACGGPPDAHVVGHLS